MQTEAFENTQGPVVWREVDETTGAGFAPASSLFNVPSTRKADSTVRVQRSRMNSLATHEPKLRSTRSAESWHVTWHGEPVLGRTYVCM